ncbi:hypothetical protein TNCV_1237871 [Trichonephila clavipes]|nr:hypothetical protein TNCV_1237871 [Trichonephila clavipes]
MFKFQVVNDLLPNAIETLYKKFKRSCNVTDERIVGRHRSRRIGLDRDISNKPSEKAVVELRLAVGHDYLADPLQRISIFESLNCSLCKKDEVVDRNHLLRCSATPSDEAHFWLNGYVNKQNCRIWSEANPQVYVETPLHPEKLTVWCTLWAGGILLPKRRMPQRYSQW